jgi:hypothetical protein
MGRCKAAAFDSEGGGISVQGSFSMKIITRLLAMFAAAISLAAVATPASAQATRTWVSGVGDDVNPCSRTAPCKTFAGAISKTAAGGEIDCLDPGGYGTLTITKSITIDCTGTFGSTLNSGGINGFVINDSATVTPGTVQVILRGLSIDGAGVTPGLNGVRFISGKSLYMEDVFIQNQKSGAGISFQPQGAATLQAVNVTIVNSLNGVIIQPTGAAGNARVTLDRVNIENNTNDAIRLDTTGNTSPSGIVAAIAHSQITGSANGIRVNVPPATSFAVATVTDSLIYGNFGNALQAVNSGAAINASGNTITSNGNPTAITGAGVIKSFNDNVIVGNASAAAFTLPDLTLD